jgi:nucleotide-binding universal stress UspA family protein
VSQQDSGGARRIVVGVDGSPSAEDALRWAVRQAGLTGARVEAVIAWHLPLLVGGYAWPPVGVLETTDFGKLAEKVLTDAVVAAVGPGGSEHVVTVVKQGEAAQVLIEAADGAEALVVGSRGHGGFTEALLGSVSQHCVHHAPCPVVIIRAAHQPG